MVTGIYQEVELSLTENLIPVTVPVKQYDNKARKVRCVLYNNSVEYTVPQNCIVACSGTRPDGTIFHYTSETAPDLVFVEKGAVLFTITTFIGKRGGISMTTRELVSQYVEVLCKIYGKHLKTVILYGSYARGDYTKDSDIDIMVLLDLSDIDIKKYRHELSGATYDFNMDYDVDIKPIAKNQEHFNKWVEVYPFYSNVASEGVKLFDAA